MRRTAIRTTHRRNDGPWRAEVIALRGGYCRGCGDTRHVECNHVWPRSQLGPSVVQNGMMLCGAFSLTTKGGCHPAVTEGKLLMQKGWLDPDQVAWLQEQGYVWWDENGEPCGRGSRRFAPERRQNGAPAAGA